MSFKAEQLTGQFAMATTPVERVRLAVCARLSQISHCSIESMHESILIRNGLYCGRKFQSNGYEVVWFIEEDEIKFFGPCGNLLSAHSTIEFLSEFDRSAQPVETIPQRRAA